MIQNTLDFNWVDANSEYQTGHGIITMPDEKINFTVKNPYDLADLHPIEVFPGYTDGRSGVDRLTNAYAEAGRIAFSLDYPRTSNPKFKQDLEGHKVESSMLALAAVRSIFDDLGIDLEEVDAEGHSEGVANATRASIEHPNEFRSLIAIASGGLILGDTQRKIFMRIAANPSSYKLLIGQWLSHPKQTLTLASNSANYYWKNPDKAWQEAERIASADIRPRFPVLSRLRIPNGALQFMADELFPLDLVRRDTDNGAIFDLFEVYPFRDANHLTPQKHPRTVARVALGMTTKLLEIQAIRDRQQTPSLSRTA